jgi:hypothetical protein
MIEHHFTPKWFKKPLEALKEYEKQQQKMPEPKAKKQNLGPER